MFTQETQLAVEYLLLFKYKTHTTLTMTLCTAAFHCEHTSIICDAILTNKASLANLAKPANQQFTCSCVYSVAASDEHRSKVVYNQ